MRRQKSLERPKIMESNWRNGFAHDFNDTWKKAEQWARVIQRSTKAQKYLLRHMKR